MSDGGGSGGAEAGGVSAEHVVALLRERGLTVAVAESLTGGLAVARLVGVPGASAAVRGGVVAYATDLKASVLGVDADLLAREGAVYPDVAVQMARGVARLAGADLGLATTGVAGPDPQDGQPVGRVFVAAVRVARTDGEVAPPHEASELVQQLDLPGDRQAVREASVDAVLRLLTSLLA